MLVTINYSGALKMFSDVDYNQGWILYSRAAQQITKADRSRMPRPLRKGKDRAILRQLNSTLPHTLQD